MSRRREPPRLWYKPAERGRAGNWIILDGTKRRSTGCSEADLGQAQRALARYIQEKYRPPQGLGQELLVTEVVASYLKDYAVHSPSRSFLFHTADPILEWWSGKKLSAVNGTNCRRYVVWRTAQTRRRHVNSTKPEVLISDQTARHDLKTLRAAIRWYKAEHEPSLNVPTVSLPKKAPARSDYWLTRSAVAARIRYARRSEQTRHLVRTLLIGVYTGTRPGAILGLKWLPSVSDGWIDLDAGVLHRKGTAVRQSNKRQPPAKIHEKLVPFLRRWARADAAHGILSVVHYQGAPIKKLRRSWTTVAGAAGAKGRDGPHVMRHTAATWLMRSGVNVYEAAGYLGMSPETLWETYGHHHPDHQEDAARATGKKAPPRVRTAK
jgi:integrase